MQKGDRYRHYKGRFYTIVETEVTYEPSLEPLVIYKHEESGQLWARPKKGFLDEVKGNGLPTGTKRFTKVD